MDQVVHSFSAVLQVVCAVGAGEDISNSKGPKEIDGDGTIALVKVAAELGIGQFVLVTSVGTGKIGFPAGTFATLLPSFRPRQSTQASEFHCL